MSNFLYPLVYFRIRNSDKFRMDLLPSLLLALILTAVVAFVPGVNFFGQGGVLPNLAMLTAALTGFYVAALTAAATFQNADLDHKIEDGALYLPVSDDDGKTTLEALTRRQWVCIMFGFLAFSAMA